MLSLFLSVALAENHVTTFVTDPQYTLPPFAGLERLYVDPAQTVPMLKPAASRPAGETVLDAPGKGQLVFTNPMSQWGEVTVSGQKLGTIGPFATMRLDGIAPGHYLVDVWIPTGFTRHFSVEVLSK